MTEPILSISGLTKHFGGLRALGDASLSAAPGDITSLIGPNGAGKTTLFNCLTGELTPDGGAVSLDGHDITGLEGHELARRGVGRTFQRLEVFTGLSVRDNLRVAVEAQHPSNAFADAFRVVHPLDRSVESTVDAVVDRLGLGPVQHRTAGDLPTGTLRLVELGRALCIGPRVLLLDELASGLDDAETERLGAVLTQLAAEGMAVVLIEHDIDLVVRISDVVYVLDFGTMIASGHPDEVIADPAVRAAYLGTALEASP